MTIEASVCHVIITGPMGSGKTALGRRLAQRWHRAFLDSDRQLEDHYHATGRQLAAQRGVPKLHELEAQLFQDALAWSVSAVIAAAASVADDGDRLTRATSCGHVLVYLVVGRADLERRASGTFRRPITRAEAQILEPRRRRHARDAGGLLFPVDISRPLRVSVDMLARVVEDVLPAIQSSS